MKKILMIGPGPEFKGGISNFNTSLAKALDGLGSCEVRILSWTNQYPSIIPRDFKVAHATKDYFKGTTISIEYLLNYNNPFSWRKVLHKAKEWQPDFVIFQWVNNIQAFPIRYLCKGIKKHTRAEIQFVLHVVKQKETSILDKMLTRHGLTFADTLIAHSEKSIRELHDFIPDLIAGKKIIQLYHPVYDIFEPLPDFDAAQFKKSNGIRQHAFLFFGFIRKYKGLHLAIRALHKVIQIRTDVTLMICGEPFLQEKPKTFSGKIKYSLFNLLKSVFFKGGDKTRNYDPLGLIEELGLEDYVFQQTNYIPDEDVAKYFQSTDAAVCFYETADASGIESICYNFGTPILATKVGHFPESIQHGSNGYLAEAGDIDSMAEQMIYFIDHPISKVTVKKKAEELSWKSYAREIIGES